SGVAFGFLAADLDGDGDRDVVSTRTATPSGGTDLLVFENLGGAQFAAPLTVKFLDAFAVTTSMVAGDLDRDGDTDLVVATDAGGAGSVSAWFGDGALGFAAQGGVSLFARALWLTET